MTNLILQPAGDAASRRNYEKTIRVGIALGEPDIQGLLTIQERSELEALAFGGRLRLWGAKPGEDNRGKGKWDRIAPGDYVLFSFGKGEASVAQVISKLHNAGLAKHLWGQTRTRNGHVQTWEYIYAVGEPRPRTIDLVGLNRSLGRKENANIQEFNVLYPEASTGGLEFLSLEQVPASPAPATGQTRKPRKKLRAVDIDKIQALDALDEHVRAVRRLEQQALRDYLMAEDTATCALCGRHFPIEFLVAAHIKPRAKCTDEEKRDIANVAMPNCKMGCDELYGRGLISVGSDGLISISSRAPQEGPVAAYVVAHLKDRQCRQWQANPEARPYFQYHHTHEFRG